MQKTTTIALIAALALVAAALIGVTYAQTTTPNPTSANPSQTAAPWCINPDAAAPYCLNATGTAPYCNNNGTYAAGNCYGVGTPGYCGGSQGYNGYGSQAANQFGNQAGYGYQGGRMGHCGRGW